MWRGVTPNEGHAIACFSPEGSEARRSQGRGVQVETPRLWDGEAYRADKQAGLVEKRAIRRGLGEIMPLPRDAGMGRQATVDHSRANMEGVAMAAAQLGRGIWYPWRAPNCRRSNAMPRLSRPIQQSHAAT
ncbi:hypothetical protein KVR01_000018 [Diaporthe batatas]|uniref:uncharacterized protein n=1 Tax=Diaporthe batatas TaxID=748121 RepID=UPI001D052F5E|nr:uncharacterized protein KVR01_000018 [Diaporthe batatas]KAG8169273.1 hypothetical protein KVR01_000018 [Diaporthe batatas]